MDKTINKKLIIISSIVVIFIMLLGVVYYLCTRNSNRSHYWRELYINFLKTEIFDMDEDNNYILKDGLKKIKIEFIDIKEENPVLSVSYEKDEKKLVDFFYINSKWKVENKVKELEGNLDFLYDIKKQDYLWYFHTVDGENHNFTSVKKLLNGEERAEYTMTNNDFIMADSSDSKVTHTVSKFDESFVRPDLEKKSLEIESNISQKEFDEKINNLIDSYKSISQMITEDIKTQVKEKLAKIEENKKIIAQSKAENNTENNVPMQEEQKEIVNEVPNERIDLELGTYISSLGENQHNGGKYILKENNNFQYINNWTDSTNAEHKINIAGTYSIYYSNDIDIDGYVIKFTSDSSESMGNTLYYINSENSFEGIQYPNTFTLSTNSSNKIETNTTDNSSSKDDEDDIEGLNVGNYNLKYGMYTYGLKQIFLYNTQRYRVNSETGSFRVEGNNILLDNGMTLQVIGNNSFVYDDLKYHLEAESKNQ